MTIAKKITAARKVVNTLSFGTPAWESAMQVVRDLVAEQSAQDTDTAFYSVDSGIHPTLLLNGQIIPAPTCRN
jgi:hypothetical protein